MELRQFRHLLAIAEHQSFHRAAQAVNLTQPAISKSLRKLEEFLGAPLVERSRRGVTLTPLGQSVCVHAKMILTEIRYAQDAVMALREGVEGEVVVGGARSLTEHLLPTAIANLTKRFPGIRLKVVSGLNDFLFKELRSGELDLVLSPIPDPPHQAQELVHEFLFFDSMNVVVRANHPLLDLENPKLEQLLDYPWVLYGQGVLGRERLKNIFLSANLPPPSPAIESNEGTVNKSLVLKSNLLSFLPYEVIRSELLSGKLVTLGIQQSEWRRSVGLTFRRRGSRSPAAIRLVEEIRKAIHMPE